MKGEFSYVFINWERFAFFEDINNAKGIIYILSNLAAVYQAKVDDLIKTEMD